MLVEEQHDVLSRARHNGGVWFLKDDRRLDQDFDTKFRLDEDRDFFGIRCPRCLWQPTASSTWYCDGSGTPESFSGGCGTAWNTFITRGRCPGCAHQWRWTVCHRCGGWSPHEDWYEDQRGK